MELRTLNRDEINDFVVRNLVIDKNQNPFYDPNDAYTASVMGITLYATGETPTKAHKQLVDNIHAWIKQMNEREIPDEHRS